MEDPPDFFNLLKCNFVQYPIFFLLCPGDYCHISQKNCGFSRFLGKSLDSRKNFFCPETGLVRIVTPVSWLYLLRSWFKRSWWITFYVLCTFLAVLSANLDFNGKLHGLVNELRGEIGATLRGSRDAKDRLLKSEYDRNLVLFCIHLNSKELQSWCLINKQVANGIAGKFILRFHCLMLMKAGREQGWRSGESTRLPPMWPGFNSRNGRDHMWVEFVLVLVNLSLAVNPVLCLFYQVWYVWVRWPLLSATKRGFFGGRWPAHHSPYPTSTQPLGGVYVKYDRSQHRNLRSLLFANSVWALLRDLRVQRVPVKETRPKA